MKTPTLPSINLAKGRGEKFFDRFLTWALTVGRVLVIMTEGLALGAFLYRFGLDRQLVTLHDRIAQEVAIVNLLKNNESSYRNLQDRLALIATVSKENDQQVQLFNSLSNAIPPSMDLTTFTVSNESVRFEGTIDSLITLSSFLKKLQSFPNVAGVSLDKLDNKAQTGTLSIGITVTLKKQAAPAI